MDPQTDLFIHYCILIYCVWINQLTVKSMSRDVTACAWLIDRSRRRSSVTCARWALAWRRSVSVRWSECGSWRKRSWRSESSDSTRRTSSWRPPKTPTWRQWFQCSFSQLAYTSDVYGTLAWVVRLTLRHFYAICVYTVAYNKKRDILLLTVRNVTYCCSQ